jgi:hypothetical protein
MRAEKIQKDGQQDLARFLPTAKMQKAKHSDAREFRHQRVWQCDGRQGVKTVSTPLATELASLSI